MSGGFASGETPGGVRASELRIDPLSGHRVILGAGAEVLAAGGPPAAGEPMLTGRADRERDLFWSASARGVHERIEGAADLPEASERWRERMRAQEDPACLHLAADSASLPAADLYALPFVPAEIARERERFGAYATRTMGGNLLGDLLQEEVRKRERVVAIDRDAVVLAAFAPRASYQLVLVPRTPRARFEDPGPTGASLLADVLARLQRRLPDAIADLWVRTAPRGAEHFCWRIDIVPRTARLDALTLGTGLGVTPVTPERAAAELRAG